MIPASRPRDDPNSTRLLHIDPRRGEYSDRAIGELRGLLAAPDLVVVNDAATLPASLSGVTSSGTQLEARLFGEQSDGSWRALLFGRGDWRVPTEDRPPPPPLHVGDVLDFDGLRASVAGVEGASSRLVSLVFDLPHDALWRALYHAGRPVQYEHTHEPLPLWSVQTAYATRPWAAEAPSAGFALTWELLLDLRHTGVGVARVTQAAGLTSTGDEALDARLPFVERYEVPEQTVDAIERARERGGRVVAVGTTTVRALEGAAANGGGRLVAGRGATDLVLGPGTPHHVVDGVLTGVHETGTSHFALLESFASRDLLERALAFAEANGYQSHEFGDAVLVLGARVSTQSP